MVKIGFLKKLSKRNILILLVVLVLVAFAVFLFLNRKVDDVEVFNPEIVVTHSVEKPSEIEPEDFDVPADIPKRITLKNLRNSGYMQMVGIDQNDDIAVPSNVLMAGWYVNSVRPGDIGLSIVTGHRDGVMKKGIFRYLGDSRVGHIVEVEYGDGSIRSFEVVDIYEVTIEDAFDLLYEKRDDIERQLNLITCGGTYNRSRETYDNRIIVVTRGIN